MTRPFETGGADLTAFLVLALVSGACGPGDSGAAGAPSASDDGGRKILRIAYNREIDVLNAFTSQMLVDIHFSMVEGLITTDESNVYIPVLAKEIPTEENGLVVRNEDGTVDMTWELHEGVRWHDGEPLTSEDVCFTWRFVSSEGSAVYNRDLYLAIVDCLMPDDHTVVLRWDGVRGYYAGLFEAILPEHVLGHMTTEEIVNYVPFNRGDELIGTGPFKFVEWKAGEYIRVVRNDDYWRGPDYPRIDEVVWAFIPSSNTRLNAMKAGQYHYGQVDPVQVSEVAELEGYDVHLISSNGFMHFDVSLNTGRSHALFSDAVTVVQPASRSSCPLRTRPLRGNGHGQARTRSCGFVPSFIRKESDCRARLRSRGRLLSRPPVYNGWIRLTLGVFS